MDKKIILITGVSSGIGNVIAKNLIRQGHEQIQGGQIIRFKIHG